MVNILRHCYLAFAFRMILGITLVIAGVGKLPRQMELVDLVARLNLSGIIPETAARVGGTALPWIEIALGLLLMAGFLLRFASAASIFLALGFIAVNLLSILRGGGADECGCFGEVAVISSHNALIIDIGLLLMAVQVLFHRGKFLSLDSRL